MHVDMVCRRKSILCQSMSAFMFGNLMNDWLVASPLDPIGSTSTIPWCFFFRTGDCERAKNTQKYRTKQLDQHTSHSLPKPKKTNNKTMGEMV